MEGLENDNPLPPPRTAGEPGRLHALEEPVPEPGGRPSDEQSVRLRLALQAAIGQLAESARALRDRDSRTEELLGRASSELEAAVQLLSAPGVEGGREEAVRRLRGLAAELGELGRPAAAFHPRPAVPEVGARPKLLVADDEADHLAVLLDALGGDYQVLTARDGQEAVELARAERPDVVLLDLNMPRLDGFEALDRLRDDPATAEIPVMLVSARGDDAGKVRALDRGAVDYLQKPFSERELRARVERTLRLQRSQSALRELAQTDALTGLANLRAFRVRLEDEVKRARRYRTPLTCVMADLDRLKPINDELGHAAGDRAIAAVARVIAEELRETDFGARYGGDEFVLLLPHTAAEEGRVLAERVCARIRETEILVAGRRLTLGSSFGVACRLPDAADGPAEDLVRAADAALYAAKRGGRGRVAVARSEPTAPLTP